MQVRWLGWAGVELEHEGESVVIDPLADPAATFAGFGAAADGIDLPDVVGARAGAAAGLVSHLHRDHADAAALAAALGLGAAVHHPPSSEADNLALAQAEHELRATELPRRAVATWESVGVGPFTVTALPAVDGLGDPQVSWLVEAGGLRVLHLGDTVFHGAWWQMARWPTLASASSAPPAGGRTAPRRSRRERPSDRVRKVAERMVEADGVELCAEAFGDPGDPPILLIMGIGASMLWWEEELCRKLANGGRYVVRYDHRDTGRSTTYPVGSPAYTGAALDEDAVRVLDGYELPAAHLVGVSAGGGIAQFVALDRPERVRSLVLISTTFATPGHRELPPPTGEFGRFLSSAQVDWSDTDSVVEYMVGYVRMLAGAQREFDEGAARDFIRGDIERAHDYAAVQNHDLIAGEGNGREYPPLESMSIPTLVVHGTADPMFPVEHGEALADEIPGARLVRLEGAGHGVFREDWDVLAEAILAHTG